MGMSFDLKRNGWVLQVTILSVVLGMLIAAALKTQQTVKSSSLPTTRFSGLAQAYLDEKSKTKLLEERLREERTKMMQFEQARGEETTQVKLLRDRVNKAELLAALRPVEGPGVEVTLQDYPDKVPQGIPMVLRDQYIIHDLDLRDIVNELYVNGAEAICIKDRDSEQRLIASSAIRCVGGATQVNGVEMASPFTIKAIGPPNVMEKGLNMHGGIFDNWRSIEGLASKMVKVKRNEKIKIPAYLGSTESLFIWAKPADGESS